VHATAPTTTPDAINAAQEKSVMTGSIIKNTTQAQSVAIVPGATGKNPQPNPNEIRCAGCDSRPTRCTGCAEDAGAIPRLSEVSESATRNHVLQRFRGLRSRGISPTHAGRIAEFHAADSRQRKAQLLAQCLNAGPLREGRSKE